MKSLSDNKCKVCQAGAPEMTAENIEKLMPDIPEWEVLEDKGVKRLTRTYKFKNFVEALDFTGKVGVIAEEEGHHPVITTEWGKVTVTWWTHKINGLHLNDFIMASKTDKL